MTVAPRSFLIVSVFALCLVPVLGAPAPAPDKAKPDTQNPEQGKILELVQTGDLDGLKALVAANPKEADFVGPGGMTPLGIALSRRNLPLVETLLHVGADPNKPFGALQMHPIQGAAASGSLEAVKDLLAKGADPLKADINGGTALHAATLYGKNDIAKLLIDKGADVNAVFTAGPNKGATPLHFAARTKSIVVVMAVDTPRSDWSIKWNGKTPAELADAVGAKDVGDYIRTKLKPKP